MRPPVTPGEDTVVLVHRKTSGQIDKVEVCCPSNGSRILLPVTQVSFDQQAKQLGTVTLSVHDLRVRFVEEALTPPEPVPPPRDPSNVGY